MSAKNDRGYPAPNEPRLNAAQLRTELKKAQRALEDEKHTALSKGIALAGAMSKIEELERLSDARPAPSSLQPATVLCPAQAKRIADVLCGMSYLSLAKRKQRNADVLALRAIASGAAVVIRKEPTR